MSYTDHLKTNTVMILQWEKTLRSVCICLLTVFFKISYGFYKRERINNGCQKLLKKAKLFFSGKNMKKSSNVQEIKFQKLKELFITNNNNIIYLTRVVLSISKTPTYIWTLSSISWLSQGTLKQVRKCYHKDHFLPYCEKWFKMSN